MKKLTGDDFILKLLSKESKSLIEELVTQRLYDAKVEKQMDPELKAMDFLVDEDQKGDVLVYAMNMSLIAYAVGLKDGIRLMGVGVNE